MRSEEKEIEQDLYYQLDREFTEFSELYDERNRLSKKLIDLNNEYDDVNRKIINFSRKYMEFIMKSAGHRYENGGDGYLTDCIDCQRQMFDDICKFYEAAQQNDDRFFYVLTIKDKDGNNVDGMFTSLDEYSLQPKDSLVQDIENLIRYYLKKEK